MNMKSVAKVAIVVSSFIAACQKSPERKVDELSEDQKNAVAKADEARREADNKSAKAYDEANRTIQKEQQKVDDKASEVARNADSVREDTRKSVEEDLGKVDRRIVELRTKLATAKATKAPRAELENSLHTLQAKSDALRKSIPDIQNASPATLGSIKSNFEARISELEKSLDDLERKV